MKKVFYLIVALIMCLSLTGCHTEDDSNNHTQDKPSWQDKLNKLNEWGEKEEAKRESIHNRFEKIYGDGDYYLIIDHQTNVQYFGYDNGYDGGMVVLVDETGAPLLYKGEYN